MYAATEAACQGSNIGNAKIILGGGSAHAVSQASEILGYLGAAQNDTHDAVSRLVARLSDVLGPEVPQPCAVSKAPDTVPSTSPLCEELGRRLSVEYSASGRINALIERLTV